jgi:hypothetical protein
MKKLVCDRCGNELKEKDDVELALEGKNAWAESARLRGAEPRGIIPCANYIRCHGEMRLVSDNTFFRTCRWLIKLFGK